MRETLGGMVKELRVKRRDGRLKIEGWKFWGARSTFNVAQDAFSLASPPGKCAVFVWWLVLVCGGIM